MRQGTGGGGIVLLKRWPVGLALLAIGLGCAFLPPWSGPGDMRIPVGGYLASALLVVAATILLGLLFRPIAGLLGKRAGAMRKYAASQLGRPRGRHRLTAAGLAVAIGMSAAMGILVSSFENTLTGWIGQLLKADVYVSAVGSDSVAGQGTLSPGVWREIEAMPEVEGTDRLRRYSVTIRGKDFFLGGADYNDDPDRYLQLIWLDPPENQGPDSLETMIERGGREFHPGWISESLSRRFAIGTGDEIALPTPKGHRRVEVAGVFAEYGNESGTLIVARDFTREWFDDERLSNLAIYARPEADAEALVERIQERFPALSARTNARLREESIRIFHQTFAVTYALEVIAVLIAVAGLGLALAGLLLERRTELATLKSVGATRREIASATAWEGVGLGLVGYLAGLVLSFFLGWILIFVINVQSFGWTLSYRIPWFGFLLLAAATVVTAGCVAGVVGYRKAELRSDRGGGEKS